MSTPLDAAAPQSTPIGMPPVLSAAMAIGVPTLLAYNLPPSATFFNQAAAFIGWAVFLALLTARLPAVRFAPGRDVLGLVGALAIPLVATIASAGWASLPSALALSTATTILAALLAALCGAAAGRAGRASMAFHALCIGLAVAGAASVVVSAAQVFFPAAADGVLIAASAIEGRATGNLRQPNHLSSLLLWSTIAVVWLAEAQHMGRRVATALVLSFMFALVLAASRTGVIGVALLAAWGVFDRRLSRRTRALLMLAPVAYLVLFGALAAWSHSTHQVFGGESRLNESEGPNSRLNIWSNTLALVVAHPWAGVGVGEFNFAWSLTPFANRPTAFFDHTHDLPLQLAVEMGVPLAAVTLALLGHALWRAFAAGRGADARDAGLLRAAFMLVLMIGVHSLLEYPLWYAYFLLPTAFAWGLCLGTPVARADATAALARVTLGARALTLACIVMLAGAVASVVDYMRVAAIFEADGAKPLAARIADGERSWLFAHHAHYAAATTAEHPSDEMPSFAVATHYLLDTRLMMAWATALAEAGDVERARYMAARLREFRNEDAKAFFAPCDAPDPAGTERPFQCVPPGRAFDYRDFR